MKSYPKKIAVSVEKTSTGYSAYNEALSVFTTGKDISDLYDNLLEALNLSLEEEGYEISMKNIKLNIDLQQFFQYYKVLNAKFLAERIGMHPTLLSHYVRGVKKPSEKQVHKIIKGVQLIGQELSELRLV